MILRNDVVFPLVAALIVFLGTPYAAQDSAAKAAAPQTAASPAPAAVTDTAQKAPAPVKPAASLQKKKTVEEDIISEDEDMLVPEKGVSQPVKKGQPQPAKADTASAGAAVKTAADTTKAGTLAAPREVVGRDSTKTTVAPVADTSIKTGVVKAPAKPVKIEEARAINFAKNLKDYRSPKLAMLMSLCIPGLGQAYIKSYWRTGLYLAAEAAIIGISVMYMNKGKDKYNQATGFADRNFSATKMQTYYKDLEGFLQNLGDDPASIQTALENISADTLKTFLHDYAAKNQEFYSTIKDKTYTQGWNDCQPSLAEIENATPGGPLQDQPGYQNRYYRYGSSDPDSLGLSYYINIKNKDNDALITDGEMQYGYSANQRTFSTLTSQSNDYYKTATTVAFILLINHVVSAVDALISANMYNADLLGRQTFWHHIEVAPGVAGRDMISAPGLTMRVKF